MIFPEIHRVSVVIHGRAWIERGSRSLRNEPVGESGGEGRVKIDRIGSCQGIRVSRMEAHSLWISWIDAHEIRGAMNKAPYRHRDHTGERETDTEIVSDGIAGPKGVFAHLYRFGVIVNG